MLTKKEIFSGICSALRKHETFKNFKCIKSRTELIRFNKSSGKRKKLSFHFYRTVENVDSEHLSIRVGLQAGVRFDVLFKWNEKYFSGELKLYKDNPSIFNKLSLDSTREDGRVYFNIDGSDYDSKLVIIENAVIKNAPPYFAKYDNLELLYEQLIAPISTQGIACIPMRNFGGLWILQYLTLTKIINPSKFTEIEQVLFRHLENLYQKNEPNAQELYPIYDKALEELKSTSFNPARLA